MYTFYISSNGYSILFLVLGEKCLVDVIHEGEVYEKDNYLDGQKGYTVRTTDDMIDAITERKHNCGNYSVLRNNCEHLVNYIRYNVKISFQVSFNLNYIFYTITLHLLFINVYV
jgi:hypothetical protein